MSESLIVACLFGGGAMALIGLIQLCVFWDREMRKDQLIHRLKGG